MRVWTNGSFARAWVGDTVFRYRDGNLRVEESVKRQKGAGDGTPDEVVAWSPKGARLDPALDKKRRKIIDAVALDDDRVAGVISEGRTGPRLVVGPPKGPYEVDLALKGRETTTVAWAAAWEAGKAPYSKDDKPGGAAHRGVRIHANPHGVAIAGCETGHVFLWRHGAEDLCASLRVPAAKKCYVDAVPTERGALVTVVHDNKAASVAHLAEDGTVLGAWPERPAARAFPTLRLDDDRALAFDGEALVLLSLPDLGELAREPLGEAIVDAANGPAGSMVILVDEAGLHDVTVDDESISVDGPYLFEEADRSGEVEEGSSNYDPVRATGPAQVAFPAGKKLPKDPPWALKLGGTSPIKMKLRSGGGPGQGIRVELSGPAIADGVVRPVAVRAGGRSTELVAEGGVHVAVLADVELVQGVNWPLDPKPTRDDEKEAAESILGATHFGIELVLAGERAGSALLTVAVSAENSRSAPLRRTRPITVE